MIAKDLSVLFISSIEDLMSRIIDSKKDNNVANLAFHSHALKVRVILALKSYLFILLWLIIMPEGIIGLVARIGLMNCVR